MKQLLTYILLMSYSAFTQADTNSEELSLVKLHDDITRAYMVEGDVEPLNQSTEDDYFLIAGIGLLESKQQVLQTVNNLNVTDVVFHNDNVIIKGETAILTGTISPTGTIMGHPLPKSFRYLSVFIREQGSWKLQARSITPVRKPPVKR
ncbi:nuclear transport factor 2 family protein [Thalassotalea sp. PS06]|uniref:nuclear transport factor 2 family protein n=1 Tax=Thalassotalea sp. PS06 TaxID=2594005 RepID=UPI001165144A|nr:nuclear transport factor 2 family protein [Thalassotalea sp. PS06]QDP01301.1 nuclear transport factor 2 family protein [Thalassotalea sp. PS06]